MVTTALLHTHNRTKEWHLCCHEIIMGRDPKLQRLDYYSNDDADNVNNTHIHTSRAAPGYLAINLRPHLSTQCPPSDSWMEAAHAMSSSISDVAHMIRTQSASYTSSSDTLDICFHYNNITHDHNNTTSTDDRSILETTVASFAASMAKQINSLRQTVSSVEGDHPFLSTNNNNISSTILHDAANNNNSNEHSWATGTIGHRTGIASCLMTRLKLEVMEPMTELTMVREKQLRSVETMSIVQNPLLGFNNIHVVTRGGEDNDEDNERRVPPAPWEIGKHDLKREEMERLQEEQEFRNVYCDNYADLAEGLDGMKSYLMPPSSILRLIDLPKPKDSTDGQPSPPIITQKPRQEPSSFVFLFKSPKQPIQLPNEYLIQSNQEEDTQQQQLQRESAALLSTYQHSDLESIHKVERSMVEITQLISRFTDLITEQQEDIVMIHDQALKSKENVDKGQNQLVDAAKRGERGGHWMATFIVVMAILLLFFNWILP
ncbi:hypothetical protein ACHAXN_004940 [Cyclotella atomus]